MKSFRKPLALLLVISLASCAVKADDYVSDDDLQNDELIPEEAGDGPDPIQFPAGMDEEPTPPEEEAGSGDLPAMSVRMSSLGSEPEETEVFECDRKETAVNCQGGGLLALPEDLDASTTLLDMSFNNLTRLSASTFPDKLENLKVLVLSHNLIGTIDKNAFSGLPRLESIDLSGNFLTSLDPDTFSGLVALSELDLSASRLGLELPAAGLFLSVPALRKLRLSGCELRQLPESTFDGTTSLEELDLGDNPIADETGIVPGVFAALTNLSALTLPAGTSPALLAEVCRSHGLLAAVCLGSCARQALPCHPEPEVEVAAAAEESTAPKAADEITERVDSEAALAPAAAEAPADDTPAQPASEESPVPPPPVVVAPAAAALPEADGSKDKNVSAPADNVPASSRTGVSGSGVNKTVIGLIIGGMLAAVALVVVKKNWSKIRGERGDRRSGAGVPRPDPEAARAPEEVPLQNKSQAA